MALGMETLTKLAKAIERLEVPGQHCQEAIARDHKGMALPRGDSPAATQWCAIGAMQAEGMSQDEIHIVSRELLPFSMQHVPCALLSGHFSPIWRVNDKLPTDVIREGLRMVVHANLPKGEE